MDIITYALCKKADKEIIDMIQSMEKLTITIVDEVPTIETAEPNRLYLVDTNHDGTYEMYILAEVEGEEEVVELGPVVDFSDYYTKEQIDGMVTPIKRLSDSEYTALTTAQKNNGTLYLVYEGVIDNHSVIGYDSEGKFVYKMTPYGCTNRNAAGNYNNHTTIAPQITGPNRFGEGDYCMKVELADGTIYYFNSSFKYGMGSASLSNYEGNVVDAEGSNVFFQANGGSTFNIMKGENNTWIGNTYIIEAPSIARFVLGTIPTGKTAIYYKSEKYAETKPDATDVVYSNATSGLSATNVQAAIDELNTNDVGKKEYVNNELKGEVFNVYTGNGKNIASGDQSHAEGLGTTADGAESHAEGLHTTASGNMSHTEGNTTIANGGASHAEGDNTIANGSMSHAEGYGTITKGQSSHAEGLYTITVRNHSHAEGDNTVAIGVASHTEGVGTKALEQASHAGGYYTKSAKKYETVIGKYNLPFEDTDLIVSELIDNSYYLLTIPVYKIYYYNSYTLSATSITIPNELKEHLPSSVGDYGIPYVICDNNEVETELWGYLRADAAGEEKTASISILPSNQNYLKNYNSSTLYIKVYADTTQLIDAYWKKTTETIPDSLFVIGNGRDGGNRSNIVEVDTTSLNVNGDIKQNGTTIDFSSFDVGKKEYVNNELKGEIFNSYSGNDKNIASGQYSHAEGQLTAVYSDAGHAEGKYTIVGSAVVDPETGETTYTGTGATFGHAEGYTSHAAGYTSHAEGSGTLAAGVVSHAEGYATQARGDGSHSEGYATIAAGGNSHAEGHTTFAQGLNSHASGYHTRANSDNSTVIGKYNIADGTEENDPKHLFIVGNGTSDARSNILEVSDTYLNVNGDIKQNGVSIASTPHTELTQAQYDALQNPDAGTEYFITDATSGVAVSSLESRLAALEMQETVYYVNGVQRVPLYSQNITKVVKVDDNTVDWYFLEPTSQKTYKARVTAQGEGNTRTNPLIIVTEVNS